MDCLFPIAQVGKSMVRIGDLYVPINKLDNIIFRVDEQARGQVPIVYCCYKGERGRGTISVHGYAPENFEKEKKGMHDAVVKMIEELDKYRK